MTENVFCYFLNLSNENNIKVFQIYFSQNKFFIVSTSLKYSIYLYFCSKFLLSLRENIDVYCKKSVHPFWNVSLLRSSTK